MYVCMHVFVCMYICLYYKDDDYYYNYHHYLLYAGYLYLHS